MAILTSMSWAVHQESIRLTAVHEKLSFVLNVRMSKFKDEEQKIKWKSSLTQN